MEQPYCQLDKLNHHEVWDISNNTFENYCQIFKAIIYVSLREIYKYFLVNSIKLTVIKQQRAHQHSSLDKPKNLPFVTKSVYNHLFFLTSDEKLEC